MSHKGTPKRQGLIKISIERPVGLHGWHNYEKVATGLLMSFRTLQYKAFTQQFDIYSARSGYIEEYELVQDCLYNCLFEST